MKKKLFMLGLLTLVSFVLGATPIKAGTDASNVPVKFSDEQVKLAQLNWNASLQRAKGGELAKIYAGQIVSVYPDSVIGKAAVVHHFSPYFPYSAMDPQQLMQTPYNPALTNNPYFDYYPYYYCTYQY